jgi:hypothetical protein
MVRGDHVLAKVCFSWQEDGAWHQEWSHALAEVLRQASPLNAALLERHVEVWTKRTDEALAPLRVMMLG